MDIAWVLCGAGILISMTGVYLFHRNVHEEGRKLFWSILIMSMGVILIGIGTARYLKL